MTAPDVSWDVAVTVVVTIDHTSLLSTVHEPGDPLSAFLQIVTDGTYVALDFTDLDSLGQVLDHLHGIYDELQASVERLDAKDEQRADDEERGLL